MENKTLKRKTLTLSEKIDLIRRFDSQYVLNKKEFAQSVNIPESSLRTLLRNRDEIERNAVTGSAKRKKVKAGKYEELEKILYEWFNQVRSFDVPISGPIIKEKASEIAQRLEIEFVPSNGWLDRFKNRHGIVYKQITGVGETVKCKEGSPEQWNYNVLPVIARDYSPSDIYNADEIGLFFRLTPDQSETLRGEKCLRGELREDRVTILIGSNADGTDKLKPLVIGRFRNSKHLENDKSLPCHYKSQNRAWMTGDIFVSWLRDLDLRMGKECRRIVLFVDHCPAHPKNVPGLENVRVEFLPADSTSDRQPMSQGVTEALRQNYRKRLVHRFLYDRKNGDAGSLVPWFDALHYINAAWDDVETDVIIQSFQKAGFTVKPDSSQESDCPIDLSTDTEADDYWRAMCERLGTTWACLESYINIDKDIVTSEVRSIDNIIDDVKMTADCDGTDEEADDSNDPEEVNDEEMIPLPAPSISSVMEAFVLIRRYASSLEKSSSKEIFRHIDAAESAVMKLPPKVLPS